MVNCIACGNYRYGTCPKRCLDIIEEMWIAEALAFDDRIRGESS